MSLLPHSAVSGSSSVSPRFNGLGAYWARNWGCGVIRTLALLFAALGLVAATAAWADPDLVTPAKILFGKPSLPSDQPTQAIGSYAKGCLAGGQPLPLAGPHWQGIRGSRNRNWGRASLIAYLSKFS